MNPREAAGVHTGQDWQAGKPAPSVAKLDGYAAPCNFRVNKQSSETSKTYFLLQTLSSTAKKSRVSESQKPPQTKSETYPATRFYSPTRPGGAVNAAQHGKRAPLGGEGLPCPVRVALGVSDLPPQVYAQRCPFYSAGGRA